MQGCGDEDCHNCYPERCDVCLAFVDPMIQTEQVGEIKTRCFGCQPVVCEDCGDQLEWDAKTDKCPGCDAIITWRWGTDGQKEPR